MHDTQQYPLGAFALPGRYTVKLTADRKSYTQPLVLKMDPRIKTSAADLQKQFEMEMGCVEGMNESYETLRQVQSMRAQLKDRIGVSKSLAAALISSIQALDKQLGELEGATQSSFFGVAPTGKAPENLSTLNQHFGTLLSVADSADAAPTTQATAVYQELEAALDGQLSRWKKLQQQGLPPLNAALKQSGLAEIDPKKLSGLQPEASGEDNQP